MGPSVRELVTAEKHESGVDSPLAELQVEIQMHRRKNFCLHERSYSARGMDLGHTPATLLGRVIP